jgi:hypothetical protein
MNFYKITFDIDNTTKIVVDSDGPLLVMCWDCAAVFTLFYKDHKPTLLTDGYTYFDIRDLRDKLVKALNNELQLHPSITSDIGYLYNGKDYNDIGFVKEGESEGVQYWVGNKYQIWHNYGPKIDYRAWMYNDKEGDIIFEVTPHYPYFLYEYKKMRRYFPFKKWMARYKPYLKTIISREKAQEWLSQAEHFVKAVDDNIARWDENVRQGRVFNDPY